MAATIGIGWIEEADFAAIVALCDDLVAGQMSWAAWATKAEAFVANYEAQGFTVLRVPLVPRAFAAWCRETGQQPDARGRAKYAELEAMRLSEGES